MRSGLRLLLRHREVLPGLAAFFFLVAPYWLWLPVWDGEAFLECLRGAAHEPFQWRYFLCYAHPSIFFVTLFAIPESLFPASTYFPTASVFMMHTTMFVLGAASIVAFHSISRLLFLTCTRTFRTLCVLLYATHPVILANSISYNFDIGVTFFLVILLALLLYGYGKSAALVGLMMVFTKESGFMLYALVLLGYWLLFIRRHFRSTPEAILTLLKRWWYFVPFLLLLAHMLWQRHLGNVLFHENYSFETVSRAMTTFDLLHPRFLALMVEIFVFQFAWLQTLVMLVACVVWCWRWDRGQQSNKARKSNGLGLLIFVYLTGAYFLTRLVPFIAIRYVMPLFPLAILVFAASVASLARASRLSSALLLAALILNIVAGFRSIDPLTAAFFGTFSIGSRQMYKLGHYDTCCILGRDQLAYNFEHTKLLSLQERAMQYIRPGTGTVIAFHKEATVSHRNPLDAKTFVRSWSPESFLPIYVTIDDIFSISPPLKEFILIDLPNMPTEIQRRRTEEAYALSQSGSVSQGGYSLGIYTYTLSPAKWKQMQRNQAKIKEVRQKFLSLISAGIIPLHAIHMQYCSDRSENPTRLRQCMVDAETLVRDGVAALLYKAFEPDPQISS